MLVQKEEKNSDFDIYKQNDANKNSKEHISSQYRF